MIKINTKRPPCPKIYDWEQLFMPSNQLAGKILVPLYDSPDEQSGDDLRLVVDSYYRYAIVFTSMTLIKSPTVFDKYCQVGWQEHQFFVDNNDTQITITNDK